MNKTTKWILIGIASGFVLFIGLSYYAFSSFNFGDEKFYSKQDLINNYNEKKRSIYELKDFFNSIVPKNRIVEIEFKDKNELGRLAVTNLNPKSSSFSDSYFCDWNLKTNLPKVDSIITSLGWTQKKLAEIKSYLDKANCIAVTNGEPTNIGFQRSGMGMYFYNLFSKPIPDSLKGRYNNGCTYILYNDKVVLQYGGGAIGPQCFPKE